MAHAMQLMHDLWFKRRDIVSDGYDESLAYVQKLLPLKIMEVPSGTECWTWTVPEKWEVREAWVKHNGKKLIDIAEHPLHVASYSVPIHEKMSKAELEKHLHSDEKRPTAIPFHYFYYKKDWGFCLTHEQRKQLPDGEYEVFIDSGFEKGTLKVGEYTIPGKKKDTVVIMAHLCHPAMANDGLTGVAVLVDVARAMAKRKNEYTYTFLILPETIGSIAYLSQNESRIPHFKYGIFLEMLGNDAAFALQYSRQGDTQIDRIAEAVMGAGVRTGKFSHWVKNDEYVLNGPGVNVPSISVSRSDSAANGHFPEYHCSLDTMEVVQEAKMAESMKTVLRILEILDKNYVPKRTFKGPVFLTRYGLWVDWQKDLKLNAKITELMLLLEGEKSVFDIAQELELDFDYLWEYLEKFHANGLVKKE